MAQFNALCGKYLARVERLDYRAGMICSTIANVNRNKDTKPEPWMPEDFFPSRNAKQKSRAQSPDDMLATVKIWNAALGGSLVEE